MIDHLVYATPHLQSTMADVASALGVTPIIGGHHVGRGTWNALISLSSAGVEGAYLEIVAPDPSQPNPDGPRPFGVDEVISPRLATWVLRPNDLDESIATSRTRGFDPGDAYAMSRAKPDGSLLTWRLTDPTGRFDGLIPFLIDWGSSTHPSLTSPNGVSLVEFSATHPDVQLATNALHALNADAYLAVSASSAPTLSALLRGPGGDLRL